MVLTRKLLLEPTDNKWESKAVLNPTVIKDKDDTQLIYRAIGLFNDSNLGYAKIEDETVYRYNQPFMVPTEEYEKEGLEDPRIAKIDNTYNLLYTAWDGENARVALACGQSLDSLTKQGIISPNISIEKAIELVGSNRYKNIWKQQLKKSKNKNLILWDKDAVLFPEKISGKYIMLHRLIPDIQLVKFNSFKDLQDDEFWEDYLKNIEDYIVMQPKYKWESKRIGAGATPIKTRQGWLLLYHGVERKNNKKNTYSAGAALLNNSNFEQINRLKKPLFKPEFPWEKIGNVNNVVFPEGALVDDETLDIFYGCADKRIGLAKIELKNLLEELI